MASEHDSSAHSSDRESKRSRDGFFRRFKRSKITANTQSQIPTSEQISKKLLKPSSSRSEKSRQVSVESQNPSFAVDQTQSQPQLKDKGNHVTAAGEDGSQSQYLWMRAYKALEVRNPDLVAAYAFHLNPTAPTQPALSPKLIEAIIEKQLVDNNARNLVFHLGTESIKIREQGEKIVKFLLWSDGFISDAVSAQPYAALAWSGVSVLLRLLLNSSKQKEAMLTGLHSITGLLRLYKIREDNYLPAEDKPSHQAFVQAIVELYTNIFEYQATLILYLSRSSVKRGIQSTLEQDEWGRMLERVRNSDASCTEHTTLIDKEKEDRFYREQSSQIEQSIGVQNRFLEAFEAFQDTRQQDRQNDQEAGLLRNLASDYKSEKDSNPRRVPGTCEWVFRDKEFLKWRDNRKSCLLWISAGPGCGKSVLSRCLIDERRLCTNVMTSTICYFFFKDGQEQRSKSSPAISAILHQLLEKKSGSSLLTYALSSYKSYGEKLKDMFSELWDILIKSARDPNAGEIVCVLDALDECEENARKQLMEKLIAFFLDTDQLENASITLKFLITSRQYEDLELGFQPLSSIATFTRFDGDEKSEKIGQEIHLFIDAKVPHIAGDFSAEDRRSISDRLKRQDNRTYLWLFLTINIIERSRSRYGKMSSIHDLLSSLPSSVSDAYEKILSRSSDKDKAGILLQIVVAARRPLTLEEANIALSIATQRESCKSHKTLELWRSTSFKSTIQNMCGLFISIYDSKIFLIHQTAREFLISSSGSYDMKSRKWGGSLSMIMAHGTMSQICIQYLNLQDFASVSREQLDQIDKAQNTGEDYLFLDYASKNWPVHYTSQDSIVAQSSRKAAGTLCRTSMAQWSHWSPIYARSIYPNFGNWTKLEIASHLGLFYVVEDFLNEGADSNVANGSDPLHGFALTVASAEGHEKIVEILLDQNVDVNAEGEFHGTALTAAAAAGHEKVAEMLVNHKADINANCGHYGTALIAASAGGSEKIVEMLLNQNADVNAKGGNYGTALIAASAGGSEKIVEMLLNQNADVNAKGGHFGTALIVASEGGSEKIVEMLLNQNADVNAKGGHYGTALIAAAARGREKIVEMLLNQNADVNAEGGHYGTALMAASAGGSEKIVEMLLNQNADVNAKGGHFGTALIVASEGGSEKIVEMLLNQNADVNAKGGYYGAALIAASAGGSEKIVEMLLNQNADVNAKGGHYGTALIAAAAHGQEKIVEMLLNQNADVNAKGREIYGTALIAASVEGHEKVVEILLDRNATAGKHVAIERASAAGHEKVIEILLKQNPDIDLTDQSYQNALEEASRNLHIGVVEMLLNKMMDSNGEVKAYSNALDLALKAAESATAEDDQWKWNEWSDKNHDAMIEMLRKRQSTVSTKVLDPPFVPMVYRFR